MPVETLVILNPVSRGGRAGSFSRLEKRLAEVLGPLEVEPTGGRGDATRIAREAARAGVRRLVVAGGDGTFHEPDIYAGPDMGVVACLAEDMDGDGILDIVIGNRCAATVIILRGLGDRTFERLEVVPAYSVEGLAITDLNIDGRPDLYVMDLHTDQRWRVTDTSVSESAVLWSPDGDGLAFVDPRGLWTLPVEDGRPVSVSATSPGVVFEDYYILGLSCGETFGSSPGHIRAWDARTGEFRWKFNTIPAEGEFGRDTWAFVEGETYGGANPWGGLTVDEERGWVFAATGSATYDFYGANRKGKNLFANKELMAKALRFQRQVQASAG